MSEIDLNGLGPSDAIGLSNLCDKIERSLIKASEQLFMMAGFAAIHPNTDTLDDTARRLISALNEMREEVRAVGDVAVERHMSSWIADALANQTLPPMIIPDMKSEA